MNKKNSSLFIGIAVIIVVTAAVTFFSGSLTGRWGLFRGMEEARAGLKSLPMQIGDWQAEKEGELDKTSVTMLQIQNSYIYRSYRNSLTQAVVHVTLMVGPAGRITVHTPVVCFGGKDYEIEANPTSVPINVQPISGNKEIADAFWRVNFNGKSLDTNNKISFYYAVSPGDAWVAVEAPRATFQMYRFVYKIQAEAFSGSAENEDNVKAFLVDCLPTIHEHLRPCR